MDYVARFVCADLAAYEELTSALLEDRQLGVARIVSHVALRPVRRLPVTRGHCSGASPADIVSNASARKRWRIVARRRHFRRGAPLNFAAKRR